MTKEILSNDKKRRVKHIYKTDNESVIKEHINNVLVDFIVNTIAKTSE